MRKQLLLVLSFVLLFALPVCAREGPWKTYTVADGLVSPAVTVIFQDSRGNLWFGTRGGGLSQFDGQNFRSFTEKDGLPPGHIKQVFEDKRGHLWFITSRGFAPSSPGLVSRYNRKTFRQITEQDGLKGGYSNVMLKDRNGDLWFINEHGLTRFDGKQFQRFGGEAFKKAGQIFAIFESGNGDIWLGGRILNTDEASPLVMRYDGSKLRRLSVESFSLEATIYAIGEDDMGNVWFGGRRILLKYDGEKFEHMDGEKPGHVRLTLGERQEAVIRKIRRFGGRGVRSVDPDRYRTPEIFIDSIFKDSRGHLWFNHRGIVSHWDGVELQHFLIPRNWAELPEDYIWRDESQSPGFYPGHLAIEDMNGNLWFKYPSGAHRYDGKSFQTFTVDDGLGSDNIFAIFEAMDGRFWFGHDNGVTVFDPAPATIQNFTTREALGSNSIRVIYEDKEDFVWFGVPGGVARYNGDKLQYFSAKQMGRRQLRSTANIVSILDGEDKGLWFIGGRGRRGFVQTVQIFRYQDDKFEHHSIRHPDAVILGQSTPSGRRRLNNLFTVDSAGNLWFASGSSLIKCGEKRCQLFTRNGWKALPRRLPRDGSPITALHADTQGNIWFANGDEGIKRYDGRNLKTFTTADGLGINNCQKIFEDESGNLWFAASSGQILIKYDGKSFQRFSVPNVVGFPIEIHHDIHDIISFIYPYTIARYDGQNFELLRRDKILESVRSNPVRASITDNSGDLWLATDEGVIRYDGKQFTTYTTHDGFLVNDIRDVKEDRHGNLWFATWGGGVVRYDGDTFYTITTKRGLIHNNVRHIYEDSQGDMWFATDGGITKYTSRPDSLPQIKLTKVIADNVYTSFDATLQLPAKTDRLTFAYQGISLQRANLLYSYKLEGYDTDWSQPAPEKRVDYNGLKPGDYTFLIKALREDSTYSNPPAVVRLTVASPFWIHWQSYLPTVIFNLAIVSLIIRLVVQRKRAAGLRDEVRQKEEAEVKRIVQELNDARDIQMGLLPQESPHIEGFELAGTSLPATEVGGDFYDYLPLEDNLIGIALADVSGKGLRSAMNAVLTNGMLYEVVKFNRSFQRVLSLAQQPTGEISKVSVILSRLNTDLYPRLYSSMFTALNLGILNSQTKQIRYTNAGQPYPIIKRGEKVEEIELGGLPLGRKKTVTYGEVTIDLQPGNYFIFFTDGLAEATNTAEEMYGYNRLKETVRCAATDLSAEDMINYILQDVRTFVGEMEQYDDITIVVLRCLDT